MMPRICTSHAPWKAKFGSGGWGVMSARGEVVAYVPQDMIHDEADATLIAAAPELLEALALIYVNAGESPEWIRARIAPAIEKANGGAL